MVAFTYHYAGGDYAHTMIIATVDNTEHFTGAGFYNPDHSYTWKVNGQLDASGPISFVIVYTGTNPGYQVTANTDHTATGTGGQSATWSILNWIQQLMFSTK